MRELEMFFKLTAMVWKDEDVGVFVTHCPALNLFSQGTSVEEAQTAMKTGIRTFVELCYRRRILDDILVGEGFKPVDVAKVDLHAEATEVIAVWEVEKHATRFDVPVHLTLRAAAAAGMVACQS